MVDKRSTLKISEVEVVEEFRNRAIESRITHTELLKELMSKDGESKMNHRIEQGTSFNHLTKEMSKRGDI